MSSPIISVSSSMKFTPNLFLYSLSGSSEASSFIVTVLSHSQHSAELLLFSKFVSHWSRKSTACLNLLCARDMLNLLNTARKHGVSFCSLVQLCPVLSSFVQFCPTLSSFVQLCPTLSIKLNTCQILHNRSGTCVGQTMCKHTKKTVTPSMLKSKACSIRAFHVLKSEKFKERWCYLLRCNA